MIEMSRARSGRHRNTSWRYFATASILVVSLLLVFSTPAEAQQVPCAPREIVVERLKSGYGESPAGLGIQSSGQLIEIWAAPGTGTWTVLMSRPDGNTCVVASGTDWQHLNPDKVAMGVPG